LTLTEVCYNGLNDVIGRIGCHGGKKELWWLSFGGWREMWAHDQMCKCACELSLVSACPRHNVITHTVAFVFANSHRIILCRNRECTNHFLAFIKCCYWVKHKIISAFPWRIASEGRWGALHNLSSFHYCLLVLCW
jgi:hypothetical protein